MQKKERKKKEMGFYVHDKRSQLWPKESRSLCIPSSELEILLLPIHDQDHSYGPKTLDLFVSIMSSEL